MDKSVSDESDARLLLEIRDASVMRFKAMERHYTSVICTYLDDHFRTDRSMQTVQTQIRLLLEEQSDQGLDY